MVLLGVFLFVLGVGIGMTMQNLVLAVQNTVAASTSGAASSAVAFFRSLGGTIGVSVLGAVLSSHVGDLIGRGWPASRARRRPPRSGDVGLADFSQAPPAIRTLIRVSYGDATGRIFLISAVVAVVARGRDRVHPRGRAADAERRAAAARTETAAPTPTGTDGPPPRGGAGRPSCHAERGVQA